MTNRQSSCRYFSDISPPWCTSKWGRGNERTLLWCDASTKRSPVADVVDWLSTCQPANLLSQTKSNIAPLIHIQPEATQCSSGSFPSANKREQSRAIKCPHCRLSAGAGKVLTDGHWAARTHVALVPHHAPHHTPGWRTGGYYYFYNNFVRSLTNPKPSSSVSKSRLCATVHFR